MKVQIIINYDTETKDTSAQLPPNFPLMELYGILEMTKLRVFESALDAKTRAVKKAQGLWIPNKGGNA